MGGVNNLKRSDWPHVVHMPQIINAIRTRIMAQEMDIAPSCIIKQDLALSKDKQENALLLH